MIDSSDVDNNKYEKRQCDASPSYAKGELLKLDVGALLQNISITSQASDKILIYMHCT